MRFYASLGPAELGPRKQVQAQRDGGGVQRQQFVLEAEFGLAGAQSFLFVEAVQRSVEQIFEQGRRAMLVGIGQGGLVVCWAMPRCTSLPSAQASPLQISRNESAWGNWQNIMATNWVQQVNPLAARSARCCWTSEANSVLGKCCRS